MITSVKITNNERTPIRYLPSVDAFKNGAEFNFKSGVNIIIGKNGSGKSTLLKVIETYILLTKGGQHHSNVRELFDFHERFLDGADVKSDYQLTTFRMKHMNELMEGGQVPDKLVDFVSLYEQSHSSTGQGVVVSINSLWDEMFSPKTNLQYPLREIKKRAEDDERYSKYIGYVKRNYIKADNDNYEITALLDEPDRNLDITNIDYVYEVLKEPKEHTQLIAVVHNPLLIYALAKKGVNIVEMNEGYLKDIYRQIDKYTRL